MIFSGVIETRRLKNAFIFFQKNRYLLFQIAVYFSNQNLFDSAFICSNRNNFNLINIDFMK